MKTSKSDYFVWPNNLIHKHLCVKCLCYKRLIKFFKQIGPNIIIVNIKIELQVILNWMELLFLMWPGWKNFNLLRSLQ